MNVSVDLKIEHAANEQGGGSWMRIGEQLHKEFNARARKLALMIQGRVIHETMEGFWPAAANDASLDSYLREYGRIWTETPKVLVSNTRTDAKYNTRILGGPHALDEIAKLRQDTPGTIGVGGATLATQLLRRGLLDEVMLFVHPVVLGSGRPLFDDPPVSVELDLVEHAAFEQGVLLQRYTVRPT
jgi:dihydrofolate reductase